MRAITVPFDSCNRFTFRIGPQFVKRNRDEWAALNKEQLHAAFDKFRLTAKVLMEDDGSITLSLRKFGIVANSETEDSALDELTEYLIEYAQEYQQNFELYYHSPNRSDHFPYVMNVLIQDTFKSVKDLITCQHVI